MTRQQLIEEIRRLPVADRVALIEVISRSLREDSALPVGDTRAAPERAADPPTLSQRLYGVLKFDGDPPTDEELKDAYADYLLEKYS